MNPKILAYKIDAKAWSEKMIALGTRDKNWDLVLEVKEQLIELNLDNPFDGYVGEDWG